MKVQKTVVVVLASPDGDARFTFGVPGLNELHKHTLELKAITESFERTSKDLQFSFSKLEKVEGLSHENGDPVTVDEVRTLSLPVSTLLAVQAGYVQAYIGGAAKEPTPEKKG